MLRAHPRQVALVTVALLVLAAPAALAASTLDKTSAAASSDVDVTLQAPVDKLGTWNERIVLEVPTGFRVLACAKTTDFSCTLSTADRPSRTLLTWKRTTPGAPVPMAEDHLPFRMHTVDRPGQYAFAVHQFYADTTSENWAPKLTVTPAAAARAVTTTTTAAKAAVVHPASVVPTRRVAAVSLVTEPAWLADSEDASAPPVELGTETKGRPSTGMVIAGTVAAVAAGGVFWLRRRAAPAP